MFLCALYTQPAKPLQSAATMATEQQIVQEHGMARPKRTPETETCACGRAESLSAQQVYCRQRWSTPKVHHRLSPQRNSTQPYELSRELLKLHAQWRQAPPPPPLLPTHAVRRAFRGGTWHPSWYLRSWRFAPPKHIRRRYRSFLSPRRRKSLQSKMTLQAENSRRKGSQGSRQVKGSSRHTGRRFRSFLSPPRKTLQAENSRNSR